MSSVFIPAALPVVITWLRGENELVLGGNSAKRGTHEKASTQCDGLCASALFLNPQVVCHPQLTCT